ncbi:MAG: substrate-binding domain-containing protein [Anaerolineales bacterium]|nr:MAG: substrate-binding domain-containing protein [Anaerolineales bacterium]
MSPKRKRSDPTRILIMLLIGLGVLFATCAACWAVIVRLAPEVEPSVVEEPVTTELRLAYSPEKQVLFESLVADFNAQGLATSDGDPIRVVAVQMDPEAMVDAALAGEVQAIVPDSSVWLDVLDRAYAQRVASEEVVGSQARLTGEVTRWAVSPVVIAMWEDTARQMGWPDQPIGWVDLLDRAQSDPDFKWSHAATNSASGLLATLAEFYAGAGITRGLSEDLARSQRVVEYVGAIEKTVRFYGEGEWAVIQRVLGEGSGFLDAFVVQEQLVVYFNQQANRPGQLVAIYPAEGTLWEDHPLTLIESSALTPLQRETYRAFRQYLTSTPVQQRVLEAGYRPADLSVPIDGPSSPINAILGAIPAEPQTTLQIPAPSVVQVVRDVWWLTKRHTNVYLVVDTSGSMAGNKLAQTKEALLTFIDQVKGDSERVGLITFASSVYEVEELDELGLNRSQLLSAVGRLDASGDTALLDAVDEAYSRLQYLGDAERINAIVVMTDGRENNSYTSLQELTRHVEESNRTGVPVVIFCIAYGSDADMWTLERIAEASGGQVRMGDVETIRGLYKILSTYF